MQLMTSSCVVELRHDTSQVWGSVGEAVSGQIGSGRDPDDLVVTRDLGLKDDLDPVKIPEINLAGRNGEFPETCWQIPAL